MVHQEKRPRDGDGSKKEGEIERLLANQMLDSSKLMRCLNLNSTENINSNSCMRQ